VPKRTRQLPSNKTAANTRGFCSAEFTYTFSAVKPIQKEGDISTHGFYCRPVNGNQINGFYTYKEYHKTESL
jgi:hypothetical protein